MQQFNCACINFPFFLQKLYYRLDLLPNTGKIYDVTGKRAFERQLH